MKACLFIFVFSLLSLVNGRGVKLGINKAPSPLSGFPVENSNYFSWARCDSVDSMEVLKSLSVTIDGDVAAVEVDVSLDEKVTGGTVSIVLTLYGVKVKHNFSLCNIASLAGKSCPIYADEYKENVEFDISYIPCGSYAGVVSVTDQNGDKLDCIYFKLEIDC